MTQPKNNYKIYTDILGAKALTDISQKIPENGNTVYYHQFN